MDFLTKLWWGGDPDAADELSGLSRRDIYSIQKAWKPLYDDAETYGTTLLMRLFQEDPDAKTYFKMIRNMDDNEMLRCAQFQAHAINLMSSLNMAILNLRKPEVVVAMMHKLGHSHSRFNIQERHFANLKIVVFNFFENDLNAPPADLQAWNRFFDFIVPHIFAKLHGEPFT